MTQPSARTPTDDRESLVLDARISGPREQYTFQTRPGVHSHDAFRTADLLLLEHIWDESPSHLGGVQANWGLPGIVLADAASTVHLVDSDARALRCARRNAHRNDVADAVRIECAHRPAAVWGPPVDRSPANGTATGDTRRPHSAPASDPRVEDLDTVAYAPRPYAPVAQVIRRIVDSLHALDDDGTLFLAATADSGLSRYRTVLESVDADPRPVRSHADTTVVAASPPDRLPSKRGTVDRRTHRERVAGVDLTLVTEPGVFAAGGLDDGTRLLLEHAAVADDDTVLDACCGTGAIGTWAAMTADCDVTVTDVDALATACASETVAANPLGGSTVSIHTADCLTAVRDQCFDVVLTNPPTHAGDPVLAQLFAEINDVLAPDGDCRFVHHRALDLDHHLQDFTTVTTIVHGDEHVVKRATP